MSTAKTFNVVGTSILNGVTKVRYANNLAQRVKTLNYYGHEEVQLFQLEEPMSKADAVTWLVGNIDKVRPEAHEVVQKEYAKLNPEVKSETEVTVTEAVTEAVTETVEEAVEEVATETVTETVEEVATETATPKRKRK